MVYNYLYFDFSISIKRVLPNEIWFPNLIKFKWIATSNYKKEVINTYRSSSLSGIFSH